jgi:hypothetical protein
MSEQKAEQTGGALASLIASPPAPAAANAPTKSALALALARTRTSARADAPAVAPKGAAKKPELEASKPETVKPEPVRADPPRPADKVVIPPPSAGAGPTKAAAPEAASAPGQAVPGKRPRSALAVVVVLAAVTGALGGAAATVGLRHLVGRNATNPDNTTLEASVVQMDADIQQLKASVEQNAKLGMNQFNSTSNRLDLLEKGQAELAAKSAKLSEAVEKPAAAPGAPTTAAAKEAMGSIAPPAAAARTSAPPASAPKLSQARLPTVQGWVLRDVGNGGAVIQGRQGMMEVFTGDAVPGLGRVDAIRRENGRWVVVTSKGLIVER